MIALVAVLILIAIASLTSLHIWRQDKNAPPGPPLYPFVGNFPQIGPVLHKSLTSLGKQYGRGVFQVQLLGKRFVIIDNIKLARQVLLKKNGRDVADRTSAYVIDAISRNGCSVIFGKYSPTWKLQRRVVHSALRMYGSGVRILEALILQEVDNLCDIFANSQGAPVDTKLPLTLSVMNVICALVFGKRYGLDDAEFTDIVATTESMAKLASPENPLIYMPWLRFFPLQVVKKMKETVTARDRLIQRKITEHRETYKEGEIRDLTDALLKSLEDAKQEDNNAMSLLTEDHLLIAINDVFMAGFETTTTALRWIFLYVAAYPEVQARIHQELDDVISFGRDPLIADRKSLPYLEATILEVLRISPVFPLIRRKARKQLNIGGYCIPEETFVYVNLWAIHHDEAEWVDPYKFRPSRFLEGTNSASAYSMLPFGAGVRVCVGESLAKMELFLFVSRLLHRFKLNLKGQCPDMEG
ncbi:predicted protein, partial [Nematostella vectensis]